MPELDREILRKFKMSQFPEEGFDRNKYAYHAEYTGANGIYIWQAKCLGWEVIRGEMPENPSLRDEKGECKMGDVVFMRMPLERKHEIDKMQKSLDREAVGEMDEENVRRDIDEKMSRLLGHNVNMSFQFRDQRELRERKERN